MKKPIAFPRCEGHYHRQAHCDIPDGLYEEEHGRSGFFGPASHLLHRHKPTDWSGWEGPLKPHCLDLRKLPEVPLCPLRAAPVLANGQVEVRYWRAPAGVMDHLVRNGDGDWLLFVHAGTGELFCDYGHLSFRDGDYLLLPRGTAWRVDNATPVEMLLIEACDDAFELPDRGLLGHHAQFDLAVLTTPKIDKAFAAQYSEDETRVLIKRRGLISTVVFPFNPLDAVGWHGDNVPVKLNWRDLREIVSDRYHLPPPVHTTFLTRGAVVCTFAPRPLESDPGALKVPFFHNNADYDEFIFYHHGHFFSRDNIEPGMCTLHPAGFAHGPHPKAFALAAQAPVGQHRKADEVAVMIDTRAPVDLAANLPPGVENPDYVNSWRSKR